jgi:ribosomal protein S6--L-glutamate ligase
MPSNSHDKLLIGSEEWCAFPSLGLFAIKARVDSGAKTSSLHAVNLHYFKRLGTTWVSFEVHPIQQNRRVLMRCEAMVIDKRTVRSSSGDSEKRPVIKVPLKLGDQTWEIEVTLSNRDSMGYRMLLGREAMVGRIMVDPEVTCLHGELSEETLNTLYRKHHVPEQPGLNIGLVASNPKLYSNQRIMEAIEERGHRATFLNIKDCYMKMDTDTPAVLLRGGRRVHDLDAVIPRIRPSLTFYGCALIRQFENLGIYTLNTSAAIAQSRDKLHALQLLVKGGLDIPVTGFANSPSDTADLISMVGGAPLIVKLLEGTQGTGVVLAETSKSAESVINAFKSLRADLLVQEFIKEANGKDLRLFVVDGKVVAAMERKAAMGEFRANIHQGGTATATKVTVEERKIAVKAAKTLGLAVAGVDIIRSSKGPLLLEVNSSPGLEGIETATEMDIAGILVRTIEAHVGWKAKVE